VARLPSLLLSVSDFTGYSLLSVPGMGCDR
jgi:hypothetical protein